MGPFSCKKRLSKQGAGWPGSETWRAGPPPAVTAELGFLRVLRSYSASSAVQSFEQKALNRRERKV